MSLQFLRHPSHRCVRVTRHLHPTALAGKGASSVAVGLATSIVMSVGCSCGIATTSLDGGPADAPHADTADTNLETADARRRVESRSCSDFVLTEEFVEPQSQTGVRFLAAHEAQWIRSVTTSDVLEQRPSAPFELEAYEVPWIPTASRWAVDDRRTLFAIRGAEPRAILLDERDGSVQRLALGTSTDHVPTSQLNGALFASILSEIGDAATINVRFMTLELEPTLALRRASPFRVHLANVDTTMFSGSQSVGAALWRSGELRSGECFAGAVALTPDANETVDEFACVPGHQATHIVHDRAAGRVHLLSIGFRDTMLRSYDAASFALLSSSTVELPSQFRFQDLEPASGHLTVEPERPILRWVYGWGGGAIEWEIVDGRAQARALRAPDDYVQRSGPGTVIAGPNGSLLILASAAQSGPRYPSGAIATVRPDGTLDVHPLDQALETVAFAIWHTDSGTVTAVTSRDQAVRIGLDGRVTPLALTNTTDPRSGAPSPSNIVMNDRFVASQSGTMLDLTTGVWRPISSPSTNINHDSAFFHRGLYYVIPRHYDTESESCEELHSLFRLDPSTPTEPVWERIEASGDAIPCSTGGGTLVRDVFFSPTEARGMGWTLDLRTMSASTGACEIPPRGLHFPDDSLLGASFDTGYLLHHIDLAR